MRRVEPLRGPAAVGRAIIRAKAGDPRAIGYLCARYEAEIDRYILSMIRDERGAERVRRELRVRLPGVIHAYDPREAPFGSWLLRVTRDVAVEHLGRERSICWEEREAQSHGTDVVVLLRPAETGSEDTPDAAPRRSTASGGVLARR